MKCTRWLLRTFAWGLIGMSAHFPATAQKMTTYKAENGNFFTVGDTLILGVGSMPDGSFNHIYSSVARTVLAVLAEEEDFDYRLPDYFHGAPVVIRKMKSKDDGVFFYFDTDGWGNFVIDIEKAIQACEVAYCRPNAFLTQEEFEKLILLYRAVFDGTISIEKFDSLRRELVGN